VDPRYDRAPNDSPRSGIRNLTPAVWGVILVIIILCAIWFITRH
jgi:Mg2+ and Co2+ transporter CorA